MITTLDWNGHDTYEYLYNLGMLWTKWLPVVTALLWQTLCGRIFVPKKYLLLGTLTLIAA